MADIGGVVSELLQVAHSTWDVCKWDVARGKFCGSWMYPPGKVGGGESMLWIDVVQTPSSVTILEAASTCQQHALVHCSIKWQIGPYTGKTFVNMIETLPLLYCSDDTVGQHQPDLHGYSYWGTNRCRKLFTTGGCQCCLGLLSWGRIWGRGFLLANFWIFYEFRVLWCSLEFAATYQANFKENNCKFLTFTGGTNKGFCPWI